MAPPARPKPLTFLRIPPFPGARQGGFEQVAGQFSPACTLAEAVALVRDARVGGPTWGRQPALPPRYALVRNRGGGAGADLIDQLRAAHGEVVEWPADEAPGAACDPWHMLAHAELLVCGAEDEARIVAAILGIPTLVSDQAGDAADEGKALLVEALPIASRFANPFGGEPMTLPEVIALMRFWRMQIDSNRDITAGAGFAFWKQDSVLPLLWGGGDSRTFFRAAAATAPARGAVAIWRAKVAPATIAALEARGTALVEVEDGFLRSQGLGADCVPPLSITVDRLGPYFDPAQPSELENLLEHGVFDSALLDRARRLRERIVAAGLGKYDRGGAPVPRLAPGKRHILVAGQVEDDRSILTGGGGLTSNLILLQRVRAAAPDAFILYKPHPDVVAGHRKGEVDQHLGRQFADKVVTQESISSLIAMVDEVHVNTSLAGFEALMRHKDVTTHGVPFYAGWGLTRDLGPVPARRTARRSLDELVAATLLLYPRYLDPVSGLPAPAEVVVDRLLAPRPGQAGPLVRLRRLQGRLNRQLAQWRRA